MGALLSGIRACTQQSWRAVFPVLCAAAHRYAGVSGCLPEIPSQFRQMRTSDFMHPADFVHYQE